MQCNQKSTITFFILWWKQASIKHPQMLVRQIILAIGIKCYLCLSVGYIYHVDIFKSESFATNLKDIKAASM